MSDQNHNSTEASQAQDVTASPSSGAQQTQSDQPAWLATLMTSIEKMVDSKIKSISPQQAPEKAKQETQSNPSDSVPDVDAIVARRLAFEQAIADLADNAKSKLRGLYEAEKPLDAQQWVNSYVEAFGLKRGQPVMSGNLTGNQVPITGGGVPKADQRVTNFQKGLMELSADDVRALVRQKTIVGAGREFRDRARAELAGVTLSIERKG